jgi:hypothetical protein
LRFPHSRRTPDIQKQLVQRQQQSDAFTLQLRQSQEALKVPPAARSAMEARQLVERVRLDNVSDQQLRDVRPETPAALRAHERYRADEERRPFYSPIVKCRSRPRRPAAPAALSQRQRRRDRRAAPGSRPLAFLRRSDRRCAVSRLLRFSRLVLLGVDGGKLLQGERD